MRDGWVDVSWEGTDEGEGGGIRVLGVGICRGASKNKDETSSSRDKERIEQ